MVTFECLIEAPFDEDGQLAFMVEKIREIGYPRIHVTIEADDPVGIMEKVDALNVELRSRGCPTLHGGSINLGSVRVR